MSTRFLTRAGLIAATYAVITLALAPISYGQVQVRVSEALTALAYVEPAAIPGLYIGVMIANLGSPFGAWDIFFGSFLTLVAAVMTWSIGTVGRRVSERAFKGYAWPALALLPPVIVNAFGVALILNVVAGLPYLITVLFVGVGQTLAVYLLGYPLLLALLKRRQFENT